MDHFKIFYAILSELEKAMDVPGFDVSLISPEKYGITRERWNRYIEMLDEGGYVKGVTVSKSAPHFIVCDDMRITLRGLEYLEKA